MIGLLIVLCIIMILMYNQNKSTTPGGLTNPQVQIEKGHEAACIANRQASLANMQMWMMDHSNEEPTIDKLRAAGVNIPACEDGGVLTFYREGNRDYVIHCSMHAEKYQQINNPGSHQIVNSPAGAIAMPQGSASPNYLGAGQRALNLAKQVQAGQSNMP